MRLVHLMKDKIVIARMQAVSGDKTAFSTVTSEMMNLQPLGDAATQIREGVFGKQFKMYTDGGVDLQAGDKLRDNDNNYYVVSPEGATRRTQGSIDYMVAVVQKLD